MEIFLSAEIEGPAKNKWFELRKEFSEALSVLRDEDYGEALTDIGIISIILRPEFFEDDGHKERRFYSAKRKEADIRLRIEYTDFVKANKEMRKRIYAAHILESVRIAANKAGIAAKKAGTEFDGERLLRDVERLLEQI